MAATNQNFSKQQQLANKRPKDLEDHEKIYLLKREIDNLRGQIRQSGAMQEGKPSSSTSASINGGFCSSGFCRAPLLTVLLALGVACVAMLARRRRRQAFIRRAIARSPDMTMTFELQDAHDNNAYQAPTTTSEGGASLQFV